MRPRKDSLIIGGILRLPRPLSEQEVATAKEQLVNRLAIEVLRAEIENTWINPALADPDSLEADVRDAIKAEL